MASYQKLESAVIHGGIYGDKSTGAVNVPIYQTSTYEQSGLGQNNGWEYSRTGNPTRAALEALIAELEGGTAGFAFASGMAAITCVLQLFQSGDRVVISSNVYGGTYRVLDKVFAAKKGSLAVGFITGEESLSPEGYATPNDQQVGGSLVFSVPITDGNATKYKVFNADRLIQAAEANLLALREQTRRDITVAMNNWRNASAAEQDKQRQVERAEEELRITELMYSEGMGAQIDLINAQTAYQAVRTEYLDAVKNMYVALVAMRKAIGDYSPDENGTWREAVQRYGKGKDILGETGFTVLRTNKKK